MSKMDPKELFVLEQNLFYNSFENNVKYNKINQYQYHKFVFK